MSFDKIFDLTAGVYLIFIIYVELKMSTRVYTDSIVHSGSLWFFVCILVPKYTRR